MFDATQTGQMAHIARLAAALDAVRSFADGEFSVAPEAQEVRFRCRIDGDELVNTCEVLGPSGVVLAEVAL